MKKLFLAVLAFAVIIGLSACTMPGISVDDSISPPKLSGELYNIQKTLEKKVGSGLNLAYPASGEYRSAIITKDIDSDGKYDVFSFYSTKTDDKTTVMHINYICWQNNEWVSVSDIQMECAGVESVDFVQLDNSKELEVLVSWQTYSLTDKLLSVYSIKTGDLSEVTTAEYSVFTTCDFDSDDIFEIVAIDPDFENGVSTASLLALGENGFSVIDTCQLDPSVTAYRTPVLSKFTDGTPALFVDAEKLGGMITEVLYISKDGLVNAIPYTAANHNVNTLRASSIPISDYNGDGCVDIPLAQKLPIVTSAAEEDSAYMTVWNSFDGTKLFPIAYSLINYTDGYYVNLPKNWLDSMAVERRTDQKMRIIYRWDSVLAELGEEILRIRAVPIKEYEGNPNSFEEYIEIARSSTDVFAVRFGSSALNPGEDYMKENFKLILPEANESESNINMK